MSTERKSNFFSRVMITDRIERHEVLLQLQFPEIKEKINKAVVSRLKGTVSIKVIFSPFSCVGFLGLVSVIHSNYFLVADWSESLEL